jgi:hypothetical protein
LSLVKNLLRALCLISRAMTQLFIEHKEITYLAHPLDTFHDGRRVLPLIIILHGPLRVTFSSNVSTLNDLVDFHALPY